ncbi:hypothetical protein DUI87_08565 [Hirundo rustica rustica]|uniref:Fibroblast growth factor n=1 Tax=Hirundo rustica rustica TaxID=333673 RepID=A0A3M0KLH2_HIRRU|nr:hypothetical protein DUI87_08565 [Hirundo rustica rustica]
MAAAAAAGGIATLPDDGGSGAFPPGHFKDPKRLYCKNGGFFLRINPDGKVDGVREKSDPHSEVGPDFDWSSIGSAENTNEMMSAQLGGGRPAGAVMVHCCWSDPGCLHFGVLGSVCEWFYASGWQKGKRYTSECCHARAKKCAFVWELKLQLQAEERGVVSIKGVSANRFLAMKEDGRLLALKYATEECFFFERLESNNYNTYRSRKYSDWYVALKRTGQYKPGPKTGPGQKAILFLPMSAKS